MIRHLLTWRLCCEFYYNWRNFPSFNFALLRKVAQSSIWLYTYCISTLRTCYQFSVVLAMEYKFCLTTRASINPLLSTTRVVVALSPFPLPSTSLLEPPKPPTSPFLLRTPPQLRLTCMFLVSVVMDIFAAYQLSAVSKSCTFFRNGPPLSISLSCHCH